MKVVMHSDIKFKIVSLISQRNLATITSIGYQRDNLPIDVN